MERPLKQSTKRVLEERRSNLVGPLDTAADALLILDEVGRVVLAHEARGTQACESSGGTVDRSKMVMFSNASTLGQRLRSGACRFRLVPNGLADSWNAG